MDEINLTYRLSFHFLRTISDYRRTKLRLVYYFRVMHVSRLIISSLIWAGPETADELRQSSPKFSDLPPIQIEKEINRLCELGITNNQSRRLSLDTSVEGILRALLRSPFTILDLKAQVGRDIGMSLRDEKKF